MADGSTNAIAAASGGSIIGSDGYEYQFDTALSELVLQRYFANTLAATNIVTSVMCSDGTYIYGAAGNNAALLRRINIETGAHITSGALSGQAITIVFEHGDYVYVCSGTSPFYLHKLNKSDLSIVTSTSSAGMAGSLYAVPFYYGDFAYVVNQGSMKKMSLTTLAVTNLAPPTNYTFGGAYEIPGKNYFLINAYYDNEGYVSNRLYLVTYATYTLGTPITLGINNNVVTLGYSDGKNVYACTDFSANGSYIAIPLDPTGMGANLLGDSEAAIIKPTPIASETYQIGYLVADTDGIYLLTRLSASLVLHVLPVGGVGEVQKITLAGAVANYPLFASLGMSATTIKVYSDPTHYIINANNVNNRYIYIFKKRFSVYANKTL